MKPLFFTELSVIPLSGLHFTLPVSECGRDDVAITIEYGGPGSASKKVHCWAWAQVGVAVIRGLVDEYEVTYLDDKAELDRNIVAALNNSERFEASLPGFIESVLEIDPGAL